MIDLRYHIVSIMAVFLALGLGILLGSSVVSDPLTAQRLVQLDDTRSARDSARDERDEARRELGAFTERLEREIAPWVLDARLEGTRFIVVQEGERDALTDHVIAELVAAGAEEAGVLALRDRLSLPEVADREDLVRAVTSILPTCEEEEPPEDCFNTNGDDLAEQAMTAVGAGFQDSIGRVLIEELIDARFLSAPNRPEGEWPPSDAVVVMVSVARSANVDLVPGAPEFARSVASASPILVATNDAGGGSVVSELRAGAGTPDQLSTFDAATDESDPGGIGLVAAFIAATEGRGGNFGTGGDIFVAPPPEL